MLLQVALLCLQLTAGLTIKLGLIESEPSLIALCARGIADAKADGRCDTSVELLNRTGCPSRGGRNGESEGSGTVNAADIYFHDSIGGLVASRCGGETAQIARLAHFWNLPIVARLGSEPQLADRAFYPTLVQMADVDAMAMSATVVELIRRAQQKSVVLVGPKQTSAEHTPLLVTVQRRLAAAADILVHDVVEIDENEWLDSAAVASRVRTRVKMIVLDASFVDLAGVLQTLAVEILGANGYFVLVLCADTIRACPTALFARLSRARMLVLSSLFEQQETRAALIQTWLGDENALQKLPYADYLAAYNACYGFCVGTTRAPPADGVAFATAMRSTHFEGRLGVVEFDAAASSVQHFIAQRYTNSNWTRLATARSSSSLMTPTHDEFAAAASETMSSTARPELWPTSPQEPIASCVVEQNCTNHMPLLALAVVVLLVGCVVLGACFYRKKRRLDTFRLHWRIPKAQIKVIENKQSKSKLIPAGEDGKVNTLVSKRRLVSAYALIGTTKAEFTVLRQLKKLNWKKPEFKHISELKRINHDNLAAFIGICYNDGEHFYILHSLIDRASLDIFINDQDFTMDNTFKSAFLRDIINGLQYLHKSPVGVHGLLTSANCLIDGNWVLKLTNFGLVNLLNEALARDALKLMEIVSYNSYFTVAPENLIDVAYGRQFPRGSKHGDLYSMGMLLHHILFRRAPFESINSTAKDTLEQIKNDNIKPDVSDALPEEAPLIDIMEACWQRQPERRPKLRHINQVVASTFESSKGNLIDQMLRMNQSYAQHLERVVNERTLEFETQKRMNARLLRQLLPASIAEKLMAGETVVPRSYEAATVLFCQLVDFARFLSETGPHDVIRFLNEIFSSFDDVISQHDAYRVETTGETYMVASGVPNENDSQHVVEISEVALQLRELCGGYSVEHMPDWKVQVRIGYHCGPLAAGVVGLVAPRFCLFGDTVNFASRMQSNCPPNQIQMSEPTALILMSIANYKLTKRGMVRVKGKGDVNTYWLNEYSESGGSQIESPTIETTQRRAAAPTVRFAASKKAAAQIDDLAALTNVGVDEEDEDEGGGSTDTTPPPDPTTVEMTAVR